MKTKYVLLLTGALILLAGVWFARAAWRVHHGVVTLHVRNVPLAEVLRKIERQTWKKIESEKGVDARITLNVVNKPLAYVLDRLAEQAGSRWSTVYAVYSNRGALDKLEAALRGDGKLEPAGWTKIAPEQPILQEPIDLGYQPQPGPNMEVQKLPPDFAAGGVVTATDDIEIKNPTPGGPKIKGNRPDAAFHAPKAIRVMRKGGDVSGGVEEEVWTPEELVLETGLKTRLGNEQPNDEIPTAATETARKVNGRWTSYVAFRKSAFGLSFGGPPFHRFMRGGPGPQIPGTNLANVSIESGPPPDFEEAALQDRNNVFERLTPKQRVRRARELLSTKQN
ncbi:MAG TPA: hypothetical protein VL361_18175 [Candidatus Limnocylindrales bacterium]|jgi:hypothetical protein|nr:hypothetical protein [Candidatus Limnocylindrales bacterium]